MQMNKNIFINDSQLSNDGIHLSSEAYAMLRDLVDPYVEKGYNIRDIIHCIGRALHDTESDIIANKELAKGRGGMYNETIQ